MKFGKWVMTRGINDTVADDIQFSKEVLNCIRRHMSNDWGDLCDEDKKYNERAIETNQDRIFSAYNTSQGRIYIITEWNRSYTTILFANEY